MALSANTMVGFTPAAWTAIPAGTKTRRMLSQLDKMMLLAVRQKRMATFGLCSDTMVEDSSPSPFSAAEGDDGDVDVDVFATPSVIVAFGGGRWSPPSGPVVDLESVDA